VRISRTLLFLVALTFVSVAVAQVARPAVAPVPPDPFEIVAGPAQVLDDGESRAVALSSLERARQNANLHAPGSAPYRLNVSIDAKGYGSARMEEVWASGNKWRWTATLGSISELRIGSNGTVYESGPGLPLRLQTLRNAIFWPVNTGPSGLLRIGSGTLQGTQLLCVLHSAYDFPQAPASRRWEETEFCVDPQNGRLQLYSQAPGMYVVFDYQQPLKFHNRTLPRTIAIYEAGMKVLDARLDSIEDLTNVDNQIFTPTAQMVAQGPAATAGSPIRFPQAAAIPGGAVTGEVQPVIVHASIGPDGKVLEAEALQNLPALSAAAVELVKRSSYPAATRSPRPRQREAFINVKFGVAAAQAAEDSAKSRF
jgi:hypothetical protein